MWLYQSQRETKKPREGYSGVLYTVRRGQRQWQKTIESREGMPERKLPVASLSYGQESLPKT